MARIKIRRTNLIRIGIAARYITPEVVQQGSARDLVLLVRGKDDFGHFDLAEPPQDESISDHALAVQGKALKRSRTNIMPKGSSRS
jgi:hypothetical protein